MTDTIPVWRQAINDKDHPMHSVSWTLFRDTFRGDKVAKRLEPRKDEIIPFLYIILDDEDLYLDTALGSGFAPVNAVRLLGEWQVLEAIPRLLKNLREYEFDDMIADQSSIALGKMPREAIEPILEYGHSRDDWDTRSNAASILAKVGKRDERSFAFIAEVFETSEDEWDIEFMGESLLMCDTEKGLAFLEEKRKERNYRKYAAKFDKLIKFVEDGEYDDL